jgi:hypothetical protein
MNAATGDGETGGVIARQAVVSTSGSTSSTEEDRPSSTSEEEPYSGLHASTHI